MLHVALDTLMEALGPQDPDIVAVIQSDESWLVKFEDVDVEIEENPETRRYFLATIVGLPPHGAPPDLHRTLLQYNMLRRDTDACLALDETGAVVQTVDLSSLNMTQASMIDVLQNIVTKTRAWRVFMSRAGDPPSAKPAFDDLNFTAIRV